MIPIYIVLTILVLHFIGDFILQSDWMAINKSKDNGALFLHASVYGLCFMPFGFWFIVVTVWTHFLIDYVTSRITSRLWFFRPYDDQCWVINENGSRHWFFVTIGFDQLVHFVTLILTWRVLA